MWPTMTSSFSPPSLTQPDALQPALQQQGYAVVAPALVCAMAAIPAPALQAWQGLWNDLPPDHYLRDGGRYRRRRHSCFTVSGDVVALVAHRPHWQSVEYNALHGGMQRHFEPMDANMAADAQWLRLLAWLGRECSALKGEQTWYTEAHQFRIDTTDGIGRPTPEGAHRDGVDLVAVFLVNRHAVKGGETRVFEADGPNGQRFTLEEPWSLLLLDDARVIHESTPIQPLAIVPPRSAAARVAAPRGGESSLGRPGGELSGYRDTLVVTLRAGGFQGV